MGAEEPARGRWGCDGAARRQYRLATSDRPADRVRVHCRCLRCLHDSDNTGDSRLSTHDAGGDCCRHAAAGQTRPREGDAVGLQRGRLRRPCCGSPAERFRGRRGERDARERRGIAREVEFHLDAGDVGNRGNQRQRPIRNRPGLGRLQQRRLRRPRRRRSDRRGEVAGYRKRQRDLRQLGGTDERRQPVLAGRLNRRPARFG